MKWLLLLLIAGTARAEIHAIAPYTCDVDYHPESFESMEDAVAWSLERLIDEGSEWEWAGYVLRLGSGEFIASVPRTDQNPKQVRHCIQIPADLELVATFHSHTMPDSRVSPEDRAAADQIYREAYLKSTGLPAYVVVVKGGMRCSFSGMCITAETGRVTRYDPATGETIDMGVLDDGVFVLASE